MTSPTPPGPAPKAYTAAGTELTSPETVAIARAQLQTFQVPVVLMDSGRQVLAEGWLSLGRDAANRVALAGLSDGAGHLSTIPVWRVDAGGGI